MVAIPDESPYERGKAVSIEDIVRTEMTKQNNGRWIFEGKDTHSWFGEAERYRNSHTNMNLDQVAILDEMYCISRLLQQYDNGECLP